MKDFDKLFIYLILLIAAIALGFSGYLLFKEIFPSQVTYQDEEEDQALLEEDDEEQPASPRKVKKAGHFRESRKQPREGKTPSLPDAAGRKEGPLSLRGTVLDSEGTPIQDAFVRVLGLSASQSLRNSFDEQDRDITDRTGSFSFYGTRYGRGFVVEAIHPSYASLQLRNVTIRKNPPITLKPITLSKGGRLYGRITDSKSTGISQALIFIKRLNPGGPGPEYVSGNLRREDGGMFPFCRSGKNGDFVVPNAPTGDISLLVLAPEFAPTRTPPFSVTDGMQMKMDVILEPGAVLIGEVVDRNDRPIEKAHITFLQGKILPNPMKTITDAQGKFTVTGAGEGRSLVLVSAEGYSENRQTADLAMPGENTVLIRLQANSAIRGLVLDGRNGRPVPRAQVLVTSPFPAPPGRKPKRKEATTNGEGCFQIEDFSPGTYTLVARANGFAATASNQVRVIADSDAQEVTIQMKQGGEISGFVLSAIPSSPLAGAQVTLERSFNRGRKESGRGVFNRPMSANLQREFFTVAPVESGKNGYFSFKNVPEGDYYIEAIHADYAASTSDLVQAIEEQRGEELRVICYKGGTIKGAVTDPSDVPLEGREVVITNFDRVREKVETDKKGSFALDGLIPGEYKVKLIHKGESSQRYLSLSHKDGTDYLAAGPNIFETVQIEEGKTSEVRLVEEEGLTLHGNVRINGRPERGIEISAQLSAGKGKKARRRSSMGDRKSATTDEKGSYEIKDLIQGNYEIQVVHRHPRTVLKRTKREVLGTAGKVREDFDIEAGSLFVQAFLENSEEPIQGVRVLARLKAVLQDGQPRIGGLTSQTQTDNNGKAVIPFLAPGRYSVNGWKTGYTTSSKMITVSRDKNEIILYMRKRQR